jgi:hypothetical protein
VFVSRREEQVLAARLARALDGQERPDGDVAALVTVLERATEPARLEVSDAVVERELARVRPRLDRSRPAGRSAASRLALAFGAVAAAAVAIVVFTFVQLPGTDVEAKALSALGGPGTVLKIQERIEPATRGLFPPSTRTVWLDPAQGRARWVQLSGGHRVEDVVVDNGAMKRYLPGQRLLIVGSSCRAFASGCAELVDPVELYRRALDGDGAVKAKRDGNVYRLTLPVQDLPDSVRIDQAVTIDATTFLPKLIEWRQQEPDGTMRPVSRIVIEDIERIPRSQIFDELDQRIPPGTRIEQRTASSRPLVKLAEERLTLAQARAVEPSLLWLGPRFDSRRLSSIARIEWNAGSAYRIRYGDITLWNFSSPVPPEVLAVHASSTTPKTIPIGKNVGRFYGTPSGQIAAELDRPGTSAAIIAPGETKLDVIQALHRLKPLR